MLGAEIGIDVIEMIIEIYGIFFKQIVNVAWNKNKIKHEILIAGVYILFLTSRILGQLFV